MSGLENAHVFPSDKVLSCLSIDANHGLDVSEVERRRLKYGRNELVEEEKVSLWRLVLQQFEDQLVQILLGAAVISFLLAWFDTGMNTVRMGTTTTLSDSHSVLPHSTISVFVEPTVILLILIANAIVGVIQESNAERAIEALKTYAPDEAKVIRYGGKFLKLPASELVPGDIIEFSVGDKVPADCRLLSIHSSALRVDQALLTGESLSVQKDPLVVLTDQKAVKQDQINMLFSGTTITMGKGKAVVVKTGMATVIGQIQASMTKKKSTIDSCNKNEDDDKSPLKKKLDEFGDQLAKIISVICILVWIINVRHFADPIHGGLLKGAIYYFKIAVALAVAAIPEGLAVVITTCLALGTKRMAKKNAIVRTLPSVETLGCTSVICSDKTGTLTTNRMSVTKLALLSSINEGGTSLEEYLVEGTSFAPYGAIRHAGTFEVITSIGSETSMMMLGRISALCNDAKIFLDTSNTTKSNSSSGSNIHSNIDTSQGNRFMNMGEPTEAALKVLSEKIATPDVSFNACLPQLTPGRRISAVSSFHESHYRRLATLDFDRDRKSMSVIIQDNNTGNHHNTLLLAKGAPESILERCNRIQLEDGNIVNLTLEHRQLITTKFIQYGEREALRVLAFAFRPNLPESVLSSTILSDPRQFKSIEQEMVFVGLAGMIDPPRREVSDAIRKCRQAGIRVIVITGDSQNTAEAICRQIGVLPHNYYSNNNNDNMTMVPLISRLSLTGREFDELTESQQREVIQHACLFSRTEPSHKLKLVRLLQEGSSFPNMKHVVAMTGDGVNDAPALKKADIGIAMGTGTDVAKAAADMVLADDDFGTIVAAVEEGRSIYANTKQFIRYLISSNIGEVVSIFLTVLLGLPEALIPVQLLWVNLVTDGLPATALGFNPPDHEIMHQPPRDAREPIVSRWLLIRYIIIGTYVGIATVAGYVWWFIRASTGPHITLYQLMHYSKCENSFPEIGCQMFSNWMSKKGTTMSLSILVTIEMFNAMNSLSENESLLSLPLWSNLSLVMAISLSMILHCVILYVPFFTTLFSIVPLNGEEWLAVVIISFPIILIDEILKLISRRWIKRKDKGIGIGRKTNIKTMDKLLINNATTISSSNPNNFSMKEPLLIKPDSVTSLKKDVKDKYH